MKKSNAAKRHTPDLKERE